MEDCWTPRFCATLWGPGGAHFESYHSYVLLPVLTNNYNRMRFLTFSALADVLLSCKVKGLMFSVRREKFAIVKGLA